MLTEAMRSPVCFMTPDIMWPASHLSPPLSQEELHLEPWCSQRVLKVYLSSVLLWLQEVRLTRKLLIQQEQRPRLLGLFVSRQSTYYTDKTCGNPWRWAHGALLLVIIGITSDASFANRMGGGVGLQRKLLHTPLLRAFSKVSLGKH